MSVSLQYLERCADETGFLVGTLEKVTRLGELAAAIARHPFLGTALALKGGTALNLCLRSPPTRMSVDLDYNYAAHAERDRMLADRPKVESAVAQLAKRLGHRIQWSKEDFAGRKLFATYRSVLGTNDRVEVDMNFLFRTPLDGVAEAEMWQPGDLDRPRVRMVSVLELCIGKLLALLDRAAPRDAWDTARLPDIAGGLLHETRFRACFIAMSVILNHRVSTYSRARMVRQLTPAAVNNQLTPMLAAGAAPDAAALVDRAWSVVEPLLELKPNEAAYVEGVSRGELRPELLFPQDSALMNTLVAHPAILWKAENARKARSGVSKNRPQTRNQGN
jgi:hypothetical protein